MVDFIDTLKKIGMCFAVSGLIQSIKHALLKIITNEKVNYQPSSIR